MKSKFILTLLVSTLVFAGCAIDPASLEQPTKEPVVAIDPEILSLIEGMGYNTEGIRVTEDSYIVEGDTEILKSDLKELNYKPKTRLLRPTVEEYIWGERGGTLTGPTLEPGNVLYTNKAYHFEYSPTLRPSKSDYNFLAVAIGFRKHPEFQYSQKSLREQVRIDMTHTFTEPGVYEVKGNTAYSKTIPHNGRPLSDVKMYWGEHYQSETYTVIDLLSQLIISGPDVPMANSNVTYSVPADLPAGVSFSKWAVSPGSYTTTSGLNSRILTIKFTANTIYTLTANFAMPDGRTHVVTKMVDLSIPATPVISANKQSLNDWEESVVFSVITSLQQDVIYEWQNDWVTIPNKTSSSIQMTTCQKPDLYPRAIATQGFTVRCRAIKSGMASGWSNEVFVPFNVPAAD